MKYFSDRHKQTREALIEAATQREAPTESNARIAETLGIGTSTVRAYCIGMIKDGYLAEDIFKLIQLELKKRRK